MNTNFGKTFQMATLMGKNRLAAARIRMRYLYEEAEACIEDGSPLALYWAEKALEEAEWLAARAEFEVVSGGKSERSTGITREDIDKALEYPVEMLVSFERGRALAFCHNDTRPSMTKHKTKNYVYCWVCARGFSPIDILKERDGMTFTQAVRALT